MYFAFLLLEEEEEEEEEGRVFEFRTVAILTRGGVSGGERRWR